MPVGLQLRKAQYADSDFLLALANDPQVRSNSFHTGQIAPDTHAAWFRGKLQNPQCLIWVAELNGKRVAQVRLDFVAEASAEISISLTAAARGQGHSPHLLQMAVKATAAERPLREVVAQIKPDNTASRKAFLRAEFVEVACSTGVARFVLAV